MARNLIAHCRAQAAELPAVTRDDVHLRWVSEQLATDQRRHSCALDVERPLGERLQAVAETTPCTPWRCCVGCCACPQSVGFAGYFDPSWKHDHVVRNIAMVERWRRFDPEIEQA